VLEEKSHIMLLRGSILDQVSWLVSSFVGCFVCLFVCLLVGLVGVLAGWLGWLLGGLVGWLLGSSWFLLITAMLTCFLFTDKVEQLKRGELCSTERFE